MRLVDADALIKQIEDNICKKCRKRKDDYKGVRCRACQYGDEKDDIDSAPTAQTEIIRCKDCRFYRPMIDQDDLCDYRQMQVFEDDYCSRAERRTDEID